MTKIEYLEKLEQKLHVLPEYDKRKALDYYDGYFSNAESEEAAILQLGTPGEVAATILADYVNRANAPLPAFSKPPETVRYETASSGSKSGLFLIGLFTFPIWLPLLITLIALAFALVVTVLAVIFAVGVASVALFIAGIVGLISSPFILFQDFGLAMYLGGTGLIALGLGIFTIQLASLLIKSFPAGLRFASSRIARRGSHGR